MQGGNVGIASAPKLEQAAVQEINGRLNEIHERVISHNERMQRLLDRAFGAAKTENANSAAPRAIPNGEIDSVRDRLADIDNLIASQYTMLNRIEQIV